MCLHCRMVHPTKAAEMAEQYRTDIKKAIELVDKLAKTCVDMEDEYRLIGLFYHTTQYRARETMAEMPDLVDELVHIEDYFELGDPTEYDLWANRIDTALQKASTLRADMLHIPRQATVEQLVHEYDKVICPAMQDLKFIVENEHGILKQLATEVNHLREVSTEEGSVEHEIHPRPWWFISYNMETGQSEMENQGQEWDTFLDWLSCLPEVRKAVEKGRQIHDIAWRWILGEDTPWLAGMLVLKDGKICCEEYGL